MKIDDNGFPQGTVTGRMRHMVRNAPPMTFMLFILTIVSALFTLWGFFSSVDMESRCTQRAYGKVTDVSAEHEINRRDTIYQVDAEYEFNGHYYDCSAKGLRNLGSMNYKIGDTVVIAVNPDDPSESYIKDMPQRGYIPTGICFAVLLCITVKRLKSAAEENFIYKNRRFD